MPTLQIIDGLNYYNRHLLYKLSMDPNIIVDTYCKNYRRTLIVDAYCKNYRRTLIVDAYSNNYRWTQLL